MPSVQARLVLSVSALAGAVLLTATRPAAAGTWHFTGPDGGAVYSAAVAPGDGATLYVGAGTTLFVSRDRGRHFRRCRLPVSGQPPTRVQTVAVDAVDPRRVWIGLVATSVNEPAAIILISDDGGVSFRTVYAGLNLAGVLNLALDPLSRGSAWAIVAGAGVLRTEDSGTSWQNVTPLGEVTSGLVTDGSRVVVGGRGGVWVSEDRGENWNRYTAGLQTGAVGDLTEDPVYSEHLLASTGDGVFASNDGGRAWVATITGELGRAVRIAPLAPSLAYATTFDTLWRSEDGGNTWLPTGLTGTGLTALAPGVDPGDLWVGALAAPSGQRRAGLFRTDDGGATFAPVDGSIAATMLERLAAHPAASTTVLAWGWGDAFLSSDGGEHWHATRPEGIDDVDALTGVAGDPDGLVLAGFIFGESDYGDAFFVSHDRGANWMRVSGIQSRTWAYDMTSDPFNPSITIIATRFGMLRAVADGSTWSLSGNSDGDARSRVVADPLLPGAFYAASWDRLERSLDHGATWEDLTDRLPDTYVEALAVSPADPGGVYALTVRSLLFSPDRAESWKVRGPAPCTNPSDLAADPSNADRLFVACRTATSDFSQGIYLSEDGGRSWQRSPEAVPGGDTTAVALDPADPGRILATTTGYGVFVLGPRPPRPRLAMSAGAPPLLMPRTLVLESPRR
jgi:photosystem II stability/assembly factor-like uncharacterized protein